MRVLSIGQLVFALSLIGVGVLCFITRDFTSVWQGAPKSLPSREILAYACGFVSLAGGMGLIVKPTAAWASRMVFGSTLLWMLAFKAPLIFQTPLEEGVYQSNGENAVYVAAAWVLYTWLAGPWEKERLGFIAGELGLRLARCLYGLALIAFGLSHFVYLNLTVPLVPAYLPWRLGWAYFTGAAYLAAGLAILTGVSARLAAALAAAQMGGFLLLIWLPTVVSGHADRFRFGEFVATCVLTAGAWVISDSYRGAPWLIAKRGET